MDAVSSSEPPAAPSCQVPEEQSGEQLGSNSGYAWFTLIGIAFLTFELFFLLFYGTDFWFNFQIVWLGIPAVAISLLIAHCFLSWQESPGGCEFMAPVKKGLPLFVYRKWLRLDQQGLRFGNRCVLWEAIDGVELTLFSNVIVTSRAVCGPSARRADRVLKFPFSCTSALNQAKFLDLLRQKRPAATMNQRLVKRQAAKDIKGTALVQSLGVVFMIVVLIDLGHSTFSFLEMMRDYHLAQIEMRDGNNAGALAHFNRAEQMRLHPLPLSWVSNKFLLQGTVAAGVYEARAEALWRMKRFDEAVESARKALELNKQSHRLNLLLARMLADAGKDKEARAQIRASIDNDPDALLPRLYMLSLLIAEHDRSRALRFFNDYLDDLKDSTFGEEPMWPPGGNRYLNEIMYQDDIKFVLDRLLQMPVVNGAGQQ